MKFNLRSFLYHAIALLLVISTASMITPYPFMSNLAMAQTTDAQKMEAERLLKLGNEQLTANQPEVALTTLQSALKRYRDLKDRPGEGQTLKSIGNAYQALKDYAKAIAHQQQAFDIAREIKDRNLETRALNNIGQAYEGLKESTKAIDYYEQSLTLSQSSKNLEMEGKILENLGSLYRQLRDYQKVIRYRKQHLIIAQSTRNNPQQASILDDMCYDYLQQGRFDDSIQTCQQALTLYRELKQENREGAIFSLLGVSYQSLGRYEKSINYFQQFLDISKKYGNLTGQARALCGIGLVYSQIGEYSKAIDFASQGLEIFSKVNDPYLKQACQRSLSSFSYSLGDYPRAIKYAQQYLEIAIKVDDIPEQVIIIGILISIYGAFKNSNELIKYSHILEEISKRSDFPEAQANALLHSGIIYNFLADIKVNEALYEDRKVLLSGQMIKPEFTKIGLSRYYKSYSYLELNKAINYLKESLVVIQNIHHRNPLSQSPASLNAIKFLTLSNLGKSYGYLQDPRAIDYSTEALNLVQKDEQSKKYEIVILAGLGSIYSRNLDFNQAIKLYQRSLDVARKNKNKYQESGALYILGSTFQRSGDLLQAEKILFEAIQISESLRTNLESKDDFKISLFEEQQKNYRTLEEVLIAQNKLEAALEISERGRARIFIEQLSKRQVQQPDTNIISAPSIQQIKQTAKQQQSTLVFYSIGIDPLGILKNVSKDLFIWIVQPTGKVEFRKVDLRQQPSSLVALVNLTRQTIGARSRCGGVCPEPDRTAITQQRQTQTQNLQTLHQLLIAPIADLLPKDPTDRVIFIPQGELFLVPFPALLDKTGKFLIDQHTILTAPSIQVLDLTRQQHDRQKAQPTANRPTLIVGNPTMPKIRTQVGGELEQLSNLAGAEQEAQSIAKLFNTIALIGPNAKKSTIVPKLSNARIIHLATHGLLDDFKGFGVPGAIALGPDGNGEENDGLLTSNDILDLKLNAELVVLSACDTGQGRITGDGVIGLSRSLITAGVPSIIVSLWKVPDASTAFLMTEFYKNLQHNPNKAQALRQAMQTTKQTYPDPLDWAAFTLIGEAE